MYIIIIICLWQHCMPSTKSNNKFWLYWWCSWKVSAQISHRKYPSKFVFHLLSVQRNSKKYTQSLFACFQCKIYLLSIKQKSKQVSRFFSSPYCSVCEFNWINTYSMIAKKTQKNEIHRLICVHKQRKKNKNCI